MVTPPERIPGRGLVALVRRESQGSPMIKTGDTVHFEAGRYEVVGVEGSAATQDLGLLVEPIPDAWTPSRRATDGVKKDLGKPRYDLLPHAAVHEVVKVLNFGCQKYSAENWRKVPGWRWRYYGAALRHLTAWWMGEKNDPESGLHHLAHTLCCVAFLLELDQIDAPDPWEGSKSTPPRKNV